MNTVFKRMIDENVPKFNKKIVDGMVPDDLKKVVDYIDDIFRSSCKSFNTELDIHYRGYRYVSPEEEFEKNYASKTTRKEYDLAKSDTYPVCFIFEFEGQKIDKILLVPYARKGNLMAISDVERVLIPVVSDSVLTISVSDVFCRLHKDKITFKSDLYHFIYNGDTCISKNIYVIILKDKVTVEGYGKVSLPNAGLNILGKYGFKEAVKRYIGKELSEQDLELREDDVIMVQGDTSKYTKDYNIYGSRNVKPNDMILAEQYIPHHISICVHKRIKETAFIKNFLFGIIHSFDVAFDNARMIFNYLQEGDVEEEIRHWRKTLGVITYKGKRGVLKIEEDTNDIITSEDNFLNKILINRLATIGIYVETFYDLVYEIMKNFDEWSLNAKTFNMDLNNRHVDILYYMCYRYIEGINRTIYHINKRHKKAKQTNKQITYKEICNAFRKELSTEMIYGIVKSKDRHFNIKDPEVFNAFIYSGATSMLEDQSCAQGVLVPREKRNPPHTKFLNAPSIYMGSTFFIRKKKPGIPFNINPFTDIDPKTGKFVFPKDIKADIEHVKKLLLAMTEDTEGFEGISTDSTVEKVSD